MGTLLRLGGISLIIRTFVLGVGSYASFRGAQVEKLEELVPGIVGSAKVSAGWVSLAPGVGIALMALGLLAAVAVLAIFIRDKLARKTYLSYGDKGRKLIVSSRPEPSSTLPGG